ncbi:hypothetical protein E8E15_004022 [Penicillium rubens]|nr:hypothetical protein E8E15_004022 [Penicillium rubens]
MTRHANNQHLWKEAIDTLDKELQDKIRSRNQELVDLESVLSSAESKKAECNSNRNARGSKLYQVLGRVVQRLSKFKDIGDSVAAIDPTHLAIPWAAIKLALQVSVKDFENNQTVCEGIDIFSGLVPRYALFERLYLHPTFPLQDLLEKALVKLYATALKYLLKVEEYLTTRTFKRITKGVLFAYDEFDGWMDEIKEQQRIADESARLIDARASRDSDSKLDSIKTEQDALREGLEYFHEPIQFIRDGLVNLSNSWTEHERNEQERRIFKWLARLPLDEVHKRKLEARLPDSGHWIFEEANYKQWRVSSKSELLWLHGLPATGKSTLMSTVIDSLQTKHAHAPVGPLAYAFFSRNDSDRRWQDPGTLVCCLIAQLARPGPARPGHPVPLRGEVIRAYENMVQERGDIAIAEGARPAWNDAIRLLFGLIDQGTTTICIDAIDECDEDLRGDLLDLFDRLLTRVEGGRVKILVSSRPWLKMLDRFPSWPSNDIDVGKNCADLRAYARHRAAECVKRMRQRAHSVPDNWEETTIQQLVEDSQGMFLWVKLRANMLLLQSDSTIFGGDLGLEPSKDLPKSLLQLFGTIYNRIITNSPQGSITRQAVLTLFRWLLCAQAPVPAEDLIRALRIFIGKYRIGYEIQGSNITVPMVLESCQDLVVVDQDSNEIRFVHSSVGDFLKPKDGMQPAQQHAAVANLCLTTVQNLASEPPAASSLPRDKFHYYVVLYWASHVAQAGQQHQMQTIHDALDGLCQERPWFKSWLPEIKPASLLVLTWDDPHKDKIMQSLSSPATSFFTACAFGFTKVVRHCIQSNGNLICQVNDMGATGLHLAAEYGHEEIAKVLCEAGADLNPTDTDGETPLIRAAVGGYEGLVLMLLKEGASIHAQGRRYGTALHGAALNGHLDVVKILLSHGAGINITAGQFSTALHAACLRGKVMVVNWLLNSGADANAPGGATNKAQDKTTPGPTVEGSFLVAAQYILESKRVAGARNPHVSRHSRNEQIFQLSLDRHVDVNTLAEGFGPPLHIAARAGHDAVVNILLSHPGVSSNCQGGEYGSALQAAAAAGRTSIVRQLLTAKADPNMQAGRYGTALAAACRQANLGLAELLLQSDAAVNVQGGVYGSALHAACRSGNHLLVQRLLEAGADVNLIGGDYCTALQAASRDGYDVIVHILLQHGANVNVQGGSFGSALRAAAVGGHPRVVKMLCEAKAEVEGGLQMACLGGHQAVAEILLARGADLNGSSEGLDTPLQAAMAGRHHSLARWLLEKGARATDSSGIRGTSLQLAALAGEAELVDIFLEQGANPWKKNDRLDTKVIEKLGIKLPTGGYPTYPIVLAAAGGHSQVVTRLLDALPPNVFTSSDHNDRRSDQSDTARSRPKYALRSALCMALDTSHETVVNLLLDRDVPFDLATVEHACRVSKPSVVISLLKMQDPLTSEQDRYMNGIRAISKAALHKRLGVVELLLPLAIQSERFVPTDLEEALQNAVSCKDLETVNKLLHCGASPTIQSDPLWQSDLADEHEETMQTPLDRQEEVAISRNDHCKALQTAAYNGAEDSIILLLAGGVDVNIEGGHYGTAVQAAAAGGHETIVERLISAGADLSSQGGEPKYYGKPNFIKQWTTGSSTKIRARYETIKRKFEATSIRKQCGLYGTALQAAAMSGNAKIVAMLIKAGADVNDIDSLGQTPLHRAAYYKHLDVITCLIENGADIEAIDSKGYSPVLFAAQMGDREIFECLFASATKSFTSTISAVMKQRSLHLASQHGNIDIIKYLIPEQIHSVDEKGQTALFIAASNGQCSTVRFLIENGSDILCRDRKQRTALHLAAASGHDDVARLLLTSGSDILAVDNRGWSALHCAAAAGRSKVRSSKVVYLLMERGVPPNIQDFSGKIALHLAVSSRNSETVTILLNNRANINAKTNDGETPIGLSLQTGDDHLRDLLIRYGATNPSNTERSVESRSLPRGGAHRSLRRGGARRSLPRGGAHRSWRRGGARRSSPASEPFPDAVTENSASHPRSISSETADGFFLSSSSQGSDLPSTTSTVNDSQDDERMGSDARDDERTGSDARDDERTGSDARDDERMGSDARDDERTANDDVTS